MSVIAGRLPARVAALSAFQAAGIFNEADLFACAALLNAIAAPPDLEAAIVLGLALAVRAPREGHVCVELADVAQRMAGYGAGGSLSWPEPANWIRVLRACPELVSEAAAAHNMPRHPLVLADGRLYLARAWADELQLATRLTAWAQQPVIVAPEPHYTAGLSPDQLAAMQLLLAGRFGVLTGGPGSGKTTTIARVLLDLLHDAPAAFQFAVAAPTGKAASRLHEVLLAACRQAGAPESVLLRVQAAHASTLHRLLGYAPQRAEGRYKFNAANPLALDLLIMDEASMVSLPLMARTVAALRADARLLLVGDPDQLVSVEAGSVLADIVRVPPAMRTHPVLRRVARLTQSHRFVPGSAMAALAASMDAGDAEATLAVLSAARADVRWIDPAADAAQLLELKHEVGRHAQQIAAQAAAGNALGALASLFFLRTLCAHRHGQWGVNEWNGLIERQVHPAGGERWFVGLPVMVTSNDAKLELFNGDIGVVVHHNGQRRVAFSDANESAQSVRYFSPAQLGSTEPVHAMTIHKSQGSEFAQVVVVLPPAGSRLLTRELLYTAFTRARQSLTVVGTAAALRTAVATPVARASGLSQQLLEARLLEEPAPERGVSATQK